MTAGFAGLSPVPVSAPGGLAGLAGQAVILNYTGYNYHFGCFATASALYSLLIEDGYAVSTLSVQMTHHLSSPPDGPDDLFDPARFQAFTAANPVIADLLRFASLVIVNGEGTLHGMKSGPRSLLYLTAAAAFHHGLPTYLVNHSLFPADKSALCPPPERDLYRAAVSLPRAIAVRDALSAAIYRELDIPAVQSFDLLPVFAARAGLLDEGAAREDDLIVVGVGVDFSPDQVRALAETVKRALPGRWRLVFLNGGPRREPRPEQTALAEMQAIDPRFVPGEPDAAREHRDGVRAQAWLRLLARARLVITGRYHHVVAALTFGTPVVSLSSNTPKIEGSLRLLGFEQKVIEPRRPGWEAALAEAIAAALRGEAVATTPAQRRQILDYAAANAVWRDRAEKS